MREFSKHNKIIRPTVLNPNDEQLALKILSARRGRGSNDRPKNLGNIASKFAPNSKSDKTRHLNILHEKWREIMGENIAKLCAPEAIKGKNLYLRAIGAATPLLQMRSKEILGLASLAIGIELNKITFIQTKLEKPKTNKSGPKPLNAEAAQKLEREIANIENERLKNAIRMLNRYIQNMA